MKRGVSSRVIAAALVSSQLVWPMLAAAQSSRGSSVGIVTTVSGEATVLRADRPTQPVSLKEPKTVSGTVF